MKTVFSVSKILLKRVILFSVGQTDEIIGAHMVELTQFDQIVYFQLGSSVLYMTISLL